MSAAAMLSSGAAAPTPSEADGRGSSPPRRRPSVERLMRLVRTDRRFALAFGIEAVIPLSAEGVLAGLLAQIRVSDELGVFRPIQALAGYTLSWVLTRAMGRDDEGVIARGLAALVAAGIVIELPGEGRPAALTVPLAWETLTQAPRARPGPVTLETLEAMSPTERRAYEAAGKDRGGRPRKGEDPRQRRMRLLGVAGGPAGFTETSPEVSREVLPEVSGVSVSGFGVFSGAAVSGIRPGGFGFRPQTGFLPPEVQNAAAASEDIVNSQQVQQRQRHAFLRAGASETLHAENLGFTAEVSENLEVSSEVSSEVFGEVSGSEVSGGPAASAVADRLAREFAGHFRWSPAHARAAPARMQAYLDDGYSPEQLRGALAARAEVQCSSAAYFADVLATMFPEVLRPPLPPGGPVARSRPGPAPGSGLSGRAGGTRAEENFNALLRRAGGAAVRAGPDGPVIDAEDGG